MVPHVDDGPGIQLRCIPATDDAFAARVRDVFLRNTAGGEAILDDVIATTQAELRGEFASVTLHLQDELATFGPKVVYAYRHGSVLTAPWTD